MLRNVKSKWSLKLRRGTGLEAEYVSDNHRIKEILKGWRRERDMWPGLVMVVNSSTEDSYGLLFAENCRIWDEKEGAERQKSFFDDGVVCGGAEGNIESIGSLRHLCL